MSQEPEPADVTTGGEVSPRTDQQRANEETPPQGQRRLEPHGSQGGENFEHGSRPADEKPGEKLPPLDEDRHLHGREVPGLNHEGYAEAEIIEPD